MKSNTGSKTKGTNGHTIKHLNKMNKNKLVKMVQRKLQDYKPEMVKRVMIPKPDGDKRSFGIPIIEERLVQQMILQVF
jgi:retron-type reverse transcriptase